MLFKSSAPSTMKLAAAAALSLGIVASAHGTTITMINSVDITGFAGSKIDIAGVAKDGTIVGTIRWTSGSSSDTAFFWKNGVLTELDGLGAGTSGLGISADGKTLIGSANDPDAPVARNASRVMYVSDLGGSNTTSYIPFTGYDEISLGVTAYLNGGPRGNPISADGRTVAVVPNSVTPSGSVKENYVQSIWTASGGLQNITTPVTNAASANVGSPTALSADGSVVVGRLTTTSTAYRWTQTGGVVQLFKGANNVGGGACVSATAVSADGNTVAVQGGLWRANVPSQPFQALPGYTSLGYDFANHVSTTTAVAGSSLFVQAMTADASWVAGSVGVAGAETGWIWQAGTNTTFELTQFLSDHDVNMTGLFPGAQGGNDSNVLRAVTGLSLADDGYTLTLVGNTFGDSNGVQLGWTATVLVPEPGSCVVIIGMAGMTALRRRRRRS